MMSMLELRRVSEVYGQGTAEVHALAEVSLAVDAGSMVAVMGPNGGSLEEPTIRRRPAGPIKSDT